MKCVNCKNCIDTIIIQGKIYYVCNVNGYDYIEECVANDDNIGCDLYVQDNDDDFTA